MTRIERAVFRVLFMRDKSCLFCRIIDGEIPSKKIFEDDAVMAFQDIKPQAPFHILIVPKTHVAVLHEIENNNSGIICNMFSALGKIVKDSGAASKGYRVVINCGRDAGQEVPHVHMHVLAGRRLTWPPG